MVRILHNKIDINIRFYIYIMVDNLRFGAINKHTDKWEDPTQASKKNKYKCPDCKDDVVFCKGKKVRPYFKHRPSKNEKTSNGNEACCYYERQGESQQHKEGKNFIKFLLDNKKSIKIIQYCSKCKDWDEYGEYSKKKIITNISYENYGFVQERNTKMGLYCILPGTGDEEVWYPIDEVTLVKGHWTNKKRIVDEESE